MTRVGLIGIGIIAVRKMIKVRHIALAEGDQWGEIASRQRRRTCRWINIHLRWQSRGVKGEIYVVEV
jgi:hypothetical protein